MSRELGFYGASDDLFECVGTRPEDGEPDEEGCYSEPCVIRIASPTEGALCVVGMYAPAGIVGCWSVGVMQEDDGATLPPWPITIENADENGYSVLLGITVPDDAVVSRVLKDE